MSDGEPLELRPCIFEGVIGAHELYLTEGLLMWCKRCGETDPLPFGRAE